MGNLILSILFSYLRMQIEVFVNVKIIKKYANVIYCLLPDTAIEIKKKEISGAFLCSTQHKNYL